VGSETEGDPSREHKQIDYNERGGGAKKSKGDELSRLLLGKGQ